MYQLLPQQLPSTPGVYLFEDKKGKILYIGKAKNLKKRVSSYFSNKALDAKTLTLVGLVNDIKTIKVTSEIEAFLLESALIKKHKPFYNIKLVDDKSYPYVQITYDNNPSVTVTRKKDIKNAKYFGPYSDATALKVVLKLIRKIFPYQSVKNHSKRKCLYYHLGLCPCILANPQDLNTYKKNLKNIEKFLNGKIGEVLTLLEKERDRLSSNEEFENASLYQDKIERVKLITSKTFDPFNYIERPSFYNDRIEKEIKSLLSILKPYFPVLTNLNRIECYDISNFVGTNAVGSMVVFENGDKSPKEYRRFRIRSKNTPDDFRMMQEVLTRRFGNNNWTKPDLVVIDGGKGQVSASLKALAGVNQKIPLVGLAKREEIIVIPLKSKTTLEFFELKLAHSTPGINLIRRLRDEAHRFAITYHRLLRKKSMHLDNK